jgi:hypothetical protein
MLYALLWGGGIKGIPRQRSWLREVLLKGDAGPCFRSAGEGKDQLFPGSAGNNLQISLYTVWSRKGLWTFYIRVAVYRYRLSFVHAGILPAEMHTDKKQEYRNNHEECPVKRALVERCSPRGEEQEREDKAANGQVFVRDTTDFLHRCTNEGMWDNYFDRLPFGNGLVSFDRSREKPGCRPAGSPEKQFDAAEQGDFILPGPDLHKKGLIMDQIILLFPYRGSSFIVPSDCMIRTIAGSAGATGSS